MYRQLALQTTSPAKFNPLQATGRHTTNQYTANTFQKEVCVCVCVCVCVWSFSTPSAAGPESLLLLLLLLLLICNVMMTVMSTFDSNV
jgi:hypothetical protein